MPSKPLVKRLPPDIRKELEKKIIEDDYQTFEELSKWTNDKGFPISRSTLHSYKQSLVDQDAETERKARKAKEPGNMTQAELERENGYLSAHLAQLSARQAAVQNELIRHLGGIPAMPPAAPTKPAATPCPPVAKAKRIDAVKAALLAREPVDQVEANRRGWGLRLGALVFKLRGQGWPIRAERDHGNGMARYGLPPGWEPPSPSQGPESAQNRATGGNPGTGAGEGGA